jgi:hypothetical protein
MKNFLILITLLLFLFSACSNGKNETSKESSNIKPAQKQDIKLAAKPIKIKYLQSNGITVDSVQRKVDTSMGKSSLYLMQIRGLKDKNIENQINKDIEENVMRYVQDHDTAEIKELQGFYTTEELNVNNLFSIDISSDHTGSRRGLLYRLSDGKRLGLKDVFTEGTDYVSLLNRKIIENILQGYPEEDEILKEPFSTICPDQPFTINPYSLNIMFDRGEAGFAQDYVINIPLREIDDYVDLLDKQEDLDKNIYEKTYCITKYNNLLIGDTEELVQADKGKIYLNYPVISSMDDPDIQKKVNEIIKNTAYEIQKSYYPQGSEAESISYEGHKSMNMHVSFNCCDYIGLIWQDIKPSSKPDVYQLLQKTCTIDLKTGKLVDPKEMLDSYANSNMEFKRAFTQKILNVLRSTAENINIRNIEKLGIDEAYSFLVNNSTIYFTGYGFRDEPRIAVYYNENLISPLPAMGEAAFYTDLNTQPESFFK